MSEIGALVRLEELAAQHTHRVFNFLLWLTRDQATAEDLAVQTFLRFAARHKRLPDLRQTAPLLFREAVQLVAEREQRRRWKFWGRLRGAGPQAASVSGIDLPSGPQRAFAAALHQASQEHQALLLLREGEQMAFSELAAAFQMSASRLRQQLFAAREALRKALGQQGETRKECQEAWRLLSAMRDGSLVHHEQDELQHHLEACPYCAERSRDYESLAHRLQALPRFNAPAELHARVFGTPTTLTLPLIVPSAGLVMLVIIGLLFLGLATAIGTAAWQSGLLAAVFDKPFVGPSAYVANAGDKGSIAIIATKAERVTRLVPVGAQPRALALSPDGRALYIAHDLGIGVMETQSGNITTTIQIPGGAQHVVADSRGRFLLALEAARGRFPTRIFVQDAKTYARLDSGVLGPDAYDLALAADGRWVVAINGRDGTLTAADTQIVARMQSLRLPGPGYDYSVLPVPNGKQLLVVDHRRSQVSTIDVGPLASAGTKALGVARDASVNISTLARPALLTGGRAALSSDGKRLFVALQPAEEGVGVYETEGFSEVGRLKRKATGLAIGPDALYVAVASEGVVLMVEPATMQVMNTLSVGENPHTIVLKP